jgi:hypothetical protein
MKLFASTVLIAAAGMAFGSYTNLTTPAGPRAVAKPQVVRLDDDPPPAVCPPLPMEMCGGKSDPDPNGQRPQN